MGELNLGPSRLLTSDLESPDTPLDTSAHADRPTRAFSKRLTAPSAVPTFASASSPAPHLAPLDPSPDTISGQDSPASSMDRLRRTLIVLLPSSRPRRTPVQRDLGISPESGKELRSIPRGVLERRVSVALTQAKRE